MEVGTSVWLKESKGIGQDWVSGTIIKKEYQNNKFTVTVKNLSTGQTHIFQANSESDDLEVIKLKNDESEANVDDLINLPYLNEPAILHCLDVRYSKGNIYTYTGPILIAVNPFKNVPLYTTQILENYYNYGLIKSQSLFSVGTLDPHIFAIADNAYRDMMSVILQGQINIKKASANLNQSILISGESGAGKTESTKIVLKYLTTLGSDLDITNTQKHGSIMDKIIQSNPILEAFGNARTIRNDNSSRFGKFIELNFNKRGHLVGGLIKTYLLEKVRLPSQQAGERNFHIFYQLTSAPEGQRKILKLTNPQSYYYTSQGNTFTLRHVNDTTEFENLKIALNTLNFDENDQKLLFNVMAGILHLGELKFTTNSNGDGSVVSDSEHVQESLYSASEMLGISAELLKQAFTTRVITARNESMEIKLTPEKAIDSRDAFAKGIYGQIFGWIVRTINQSIQVDLSQIRAEIGVLDIFGFECFKYNSFEQLCINYANETLQQQFNQFVFKLEQQEYEKEEIEWSFIEFPDNQDCLDLIENKQRGLLSMLDDECKLPGASDEKFSSRLYKQFENNHPRFATSPAYKRDSKFSIIHYAGIVVYSATTFVEKNKDELPKEADNLLQESSHSLLSAIFIHKSSSASPSKTTLAKTSTVSVSTQFKEQLNLLMEKIYGTAPHYIRCIKPNDENEPDLFNRVRVTEQLRYGGVLEAVRVARSGFPVRLSHFEFYSRYRSLANPLHSKSSKLPSYLTVETQNIKMYCDVLLETICENKIKTDLIQNQLNGHRDKIQEVFNSKSSPAMSLKLASDIAYWRGKSDLQKDWIQLGITKVFLRKHAHDIIEGCRSRRLFIASRRIQSVTRQYLRRSVYLKTIWAIRTIQRYTRGMFARTIARKQRRERAALIIQTKYRGFYHSYRYRLFRCAVISLQCCFRGVNSRKVFFNLRRLSDTIKLQSIIRRLLVQYKYRKYRSDLIKVQCLYRKRIAKRQLNQLRIAAKDLGVLKQSNDSLKAEIEMMRSKAAEENRVKVVEKDSEIARLTEELNRVKKLYVNETILRQQTEQKLKKSESNLVDMTIKYNDVMELHAPSLSSYKSLQFSNHGTHSPPRGAQTPPKGEYVLQSANPSNKLSSSPLQKSPLPKSPSNKSMIMESLRSELNDEKVAREAAELEVERLRHISVELRSQVEAMKSKASTGGPNHSLISTPGSSSSVPQRRPDVKPFKKDGSERHVAIAEDMNSQDIPLQASSISSTLSLFQQNLEHLKAKMTQGLRCFVHEKVVMSECIIKMNREHGQIIFEPVVRKFNIFFSQYDIQPIKIYDIYEMVPGSGGIAAAGNKTTSESLRTLTIVGKSSENSTGDSRVLLIECLTNDNRNTLLTGLRSLISELHINSAAMKSVLGVPLNMQKRLSISANVIKSSSVQSTDENDNLENLLTVSDFKHQLLAERVNHEQMMVQVLMITNDLRQRDEQIEALTKREVTLSDNLAKLSKHSEQDAMVRLQLGRRLEQVLIEKEEALEELEMMKIQLNEIRVSFSKVISGV